MTYFTKQPNAVDVSEVQALINALRTELVAAGILTNTVSSGPPSTVTGLTSWWDASTKPAAGIAITSLQDKAGSANLISSTTSSWIPRLAAGLGGVGLEVTQLSGYTIEAWAPTLHPLLDPDLTLSTTLPFGAGGALTLDLVWTRPNLRQVLVDHIANLFMSATFLGGMSPLITIDGVTVLAISNTGAGDNLVMWPNGTASTLTSNLTPRHTHSIRLRGSHVAGWDVFLDGIKLNSNPVPSQLTAAPTQGIVKLLGTGNSNSAQCWFHEAYAFSHVLTNSECVNLDAYLTRWKLGVRKGAIMMAVGQSNSGYLADGTNRYRDLCRGVEYLGGLASFTVLLSNGYQETIRGGHGLIGNADNYLSAAITDDPTTVPLGATGPGINTRNMIQSLPAYLQSEVCGLFAYYSENDAGFGWPLRNQFAGMIKRYNQLARGFPQFGPTRDASNWLLAWNSDIPFSGGEGHASHKAAVKAVVDDPTQNAMLWLLNGVGAIQDGGTFDPATGITTGGDGLHLDRTDDIRAAIYGVEPIARRLAAIGRSENIIPAGLPVIGGPQVASVTWEGSAISGNPGNPTALITISHDAGNDLRIPLLAANGLGWVILDGTIPSQNTPRILGTSCVRISATTLRVKFASAPTQSNVLFYYIYYEDNLPRANNPGSPGRGNLITDNYSDTVAVPNVAGFNIGTDLNTVYRIDRPLAAFPLSLSLTITVATVETLTVVTPAAQVVGTAFTITGTYTNATPVSLDYSVDNGANWIAASTYTISSGNYSITSVVISAANNSQVIKVRDHMAQSVIASSGAFAVTAAIPPGVTPNFPATMHLFFNTPERNIQSNQGWGTAVYMQTGGVGGFVSDNDNSGIELSFQSLYMGPSLSSTTPPTHNITGSIADPGGDGSFIVAYNRQGNGLYSSNGGAFYPQSHPGVFHFWAILTLSDGSVHRAVWDKNIIVGNVITNTLQVVGIYGQSSGTKILGSSYNGYSYDNLFPFFQLTKAGVTVPTNTPILVGISTSATIPPDPISYPVSNTLPCNGYMVATQHNSDYFDMPVSIAVVSGSSPSPGIARYVWVSDDNGTSWSVYRDVSNVAIPYMIIG